MDWCSLNDRNSSLTVLEAGSLTLRCQHDWALDENPTLGLQMAVFLLCPHMAEREQNHHSGVSSYRVTNPIHEDTNLMTSLPHKDQMR
jgi:hypothetical protein